ncbi:heavy chain of dynein [Chloropicon roscoffensis]|uniref:Heavy chain of dynein n=1 Tax=Chloropicon roscoffensis TaxID=1461544 RepID=A0AAX4PH71_9CHLO
MIDPIIKVRVPKTLERKEVQRLINTESGSYEIHQAAFGRSAFESSPNGKANGKSNGHANGSVANFPSPYASPKTKSQGKRKHKRLDGPQEVISQNGSFPPRPFHAPKHSDEVSSVSTATGVLQPAEEIELEGVSQTPVKRKRLKIPLEKFDDPALEVLTPSISQWLEENRGEGGIKAKSKYYDTDGTFCWATCTVTGYDEETSLFDIVWDQSGGKKKVRRFNLIFKDEDVAHFQKRIRLAKELEAEMGSRMRIQNLIASQEFKNSEMIDDNFKRRILEKYEIPHASTFPNIAEVFFKESKDIYKHAMKTAVFKYLLPDEDDQQQEMEDRESINLDHLLHEDQVPIQGCVPLHLLHPQDGMEATCRPDDEEVQTSQLALESFEDQLFTISNALGLAQEDILSCLQQFYHELDVKDQILVTQYEEMLLEAPFDLRHFETLQSRHMNDMADTLRHDWVLRVATKVEDIPYISGSIDDQLFARTVKRISLLMADSLRISALQSLSAYTNIWKKYDIDFDLLSQGVKDKDSIGLVPLFRMEMTISEGGRFELPLDELKEKILFFYDEIISSVNGIDDIGSKITILDAPEKHMETISHDEPNVVEVRDTISEIIDKNLKGLRELLDSFNGFEDLATAEVATHIENWTANPLSLTSCQEEVKRFLDLKKSIEEKCDNQTLFPMIVVNSAEAKAFLENKALELRSALLRLTCDNWCASNETICKRYDALKEKMASSPDTTEELDELRRFFDASKNELEELESDINASSELYLVFNDSRFTLTVQEHDLYWDVFGWPKKLASVVEQGEVNLNEKTEKFKQELVDNRAKLVEDVVQMGKDVDEFIQLGEIELVEERVVTVSEIEAKLKQASTLAEVYRNHESIFGMPEQDLPQLDRLVKTFEPYCNLWKICGDFTNHLPEWTDGPFTELDPESLTNSIENWIRALAKVQKVLSERAAEACKILNERLNKFQEYLPLIAALRNPGLRERHWKRMSKDLGFPVKVDVSFSLSRALQLQLLEHMEVIEEISEYASKEYSLEKTLDKMQHEWSGVSFDRMDWRDTGTTILRGIDDIQAILDDQVVKTQAMRASPYIGAFEERVKLWEKRLNNVQETIDEWLKCQQQWLYLEPIFGSDDIMQQMPNEGRKFKTVDGTWRKTMEKVEKNSEVLTVCSDDELLKNLIDANKLLDAVQKGLNDYLETKRLAFPRFYFLSNEELLEILSETKDPLRVQPFLKKIFEGINKIHFEEDLTVTAMISAEGEQVQLRNTFNPSSAGGNVERWLIDLEASMRDSVKHVTKQSFDAYATTDRNKWVIEWPGQVVICVDSLYWTDETEEAISDGKLPEYALKCTAQLKDIVDKVRGKLTKLERKTLSSLIVIDVHARDVIARLADLNIIAVSDFEWQSQLRYEWDGSDVLVRMINAQLYYGYEYLGLPSRLVITPLTDRCYRTLMGALHLDLGGAPEGPAGTGKTETTKDLAKAIAMQCVVFNCSDGLDYLAMGKFFKGLASSGAWSCFDEFNRIDLEVLSVIAQQILTIQRAKAADAKSFEFEGTRLQLRKTCNCFITMNPGYAGRSELPDNLKALFRTVAMMVPDYALIAEIMLYSSGYLEARSLARKLVATYKLCSEQLSSQTHYDYGMRAVMSVLRAAAAIKQRQPDEDEGILMLVSLKDVNLPKFLSPDIPLFNGILSDLFPGVVLPDPDYELLGKAVKDNCAKLKVQPTNVLLEKIFQLYEMILVRHGLMLVGYSYGAKTTAYRVLQGALGDLKERDELEENKTVVRVMNPKSIYIGQLYGQFDPVSHEWKDGVLAKVYRECAVDTSPDRKWVLFDGPVDAVWIENMNTVLDDNKKLCLMSGEIIQMSASMNMIFEVQDLAVASPATVSRCGMVYVEPSQIGWKPLQTSWIDTLPEQITSNEVLKKLVVDLFDWMVDPCIRFVRRNCKEVVGTADINLVQSTMRLISSLLLKMLQENPKAEMTQEILESIFIFSLVWGIGASIDGNGRMLFDPFVKKLFAKEVDKSTDRKDYDLGAGLEITYPEVDTKCTLPLEESLYDYEYNFEHFKWVNWMGTTAKQEIKPTAQFQEIIVKTVDTVRYVYLLKTLISNTVHSLVVGQTGTGKTVYVKEVLGNSLDKATYQNIQTSFSARTNANQIQDLIDGKLDKRRKGVFGPPFGTKCVIFVDDLNMPQLEVYGAQPPIEILRQWMDHGGWYERSDNTFKSLVDIQFVAAMGPPGGGRNAVTPRYMRHFNVIAISEFSDQTFQHIYEVIVEWWMAKVRAEEAALEKMTPIVKATVRIYNTIKAELLPTPSKSHYVYNMRDLSKVFQGMQTINHQLKDEKHLLRLWTHEVLRVFNDRLTNDDDKMWFTGLMNKVLEEDVGVTFSSLVDIEEETDDLFKENMNQFLFCNFLQQGKDGNPKYEEVLQRQKLLQVIDESLGDYNAQHKSKMNLVMFSYAAEHIARISRIIQQPYGNALLVGMGGSGRQSLTRIATFIADFKLRQVEITKSYGIIEWREDLKDILRKSGGEGSPTVFLFTDSQIKDESFMEDINNILNTGEIPGLYPKDEIMSILEMVRPRAKRVGKDKSVADLYDFFVEQCRYNLHTVVCMSPVGDAFRSRLRMFPSLVNCCTIDWFSEWPQDALKSVATQFLAEVDLSTPELRSACEDMCIEFHVKIRQLATKFLEEERRYYYATPTSYLELINTYKKLLKAKRLEVSTIRDRYEIGLEKLLNAEESVSVMKEELIALQPVLVKTSEEVEETLKVVDKETEQAEAKRAVVEKEEAVANVKAQAAKAIKDECEAELAEAIPLLEAAISALNTLTKNDITLVKSMKNPPVAIKTVMETVCIMLEVKPKRINDPNNPVKKIDDYWSPSQGILGDSTFLATLQKYDKDNIKPAIITKIRPFLDREDFQPENVKKAAKAAYGLCQWVRAMEAYDRVAKVVAPKKKKLAESEAEYALLNESLQKKKAELKEVQDRLESLQNKLQELLAKKKQLEIDVEQCKKKLDRAEKLIGGLGGEKTRWSAVAAKLKEDVTNLTGDVLLSSSFVAYLGAFTTEYREDAIGGWVKLCVERGIPCSGEDFSLLTVLGDQVQMRDWAIEGLPNDFLSIENAIIMSKATRWPLMIDPQGQANKWIKNKEKQASLEVLKLNDSDYIRKLENSIQFGFPVLLENVGEELDATLEPLLTRSTFKQGGSICIKLGDSVIEYNPKFHFYVTTKLRNPHYMPEISVKVTLLNFMITQKGLEDQLLALTVSMERPELEEEKVKLVLQSAENARQLKEIEDKIIEILSTSEGNILEDETAINVITSSKQLSTEIDVKQQIAKKTEKQIDEARLEYKEVATYASHLFFCVSSLANLEPMYQYSLPWFIMLFTNTIKNADKHDVLSDRILALNDYFTGSLFSQVCRSLFEKDKLLFGFALCISIYGHNLGQISLEQFRFLITGGVEISSGFDEQPDKKPAWLSKKSWIEFVKLATFYDKYKGISDHIAENADSWKVLWDVPDPTSTPLPDPWESKLDTFEKLLVTRCIRPDKLPVAVQNFLMGKMGKKYVESPPFDLSGCYNDSLATVPLVFILSPGSDPMSSLLSFADGLKTPVSSISLGQGQGPKAEKMIKDAQSSGEWVVLQNCHLAVSWMSSLEDICENITMENTNPNFRLWLTSYPSEHFPVSILQNSVKMTNEPPKGLRANLLQTYSSNPLSDPAFFEGCGERSPEFKKLLFGLCTFHAIVQERLSFGPIGWNVKYQFSTPDFVISVRQLQMFLNEYPEDLPLQALIYLTGECNYGGRVTDAKDRRTLMSILDVFYNFDVFNDEYTFSSSGNYYAPPDGEYPSYIEFIKKLPLTSAPEAFGLHANADITKDQKETDLFLASLATSQSTASGGANKGKDAALKEIVQVVKNKMPEPFDLEYANYKYPVMYLESMNTVLCQEMVRFNRLIEVIKKSIADLAKALEGLVVMSGDLEALGNSMYDGKIPALWAGKSYPSLKPLPSYVDDLCKRLKMLQDWLDDGPPNVFWISGFYFTHAFLTGIKQNFARRNKIPIDTLGFDYTCQPIREVTEKHEVGAFVNGMFLEGARWDYDAFQLEDSEPKVLYSEAPMLLVEPVELTKRKSFPHYECPLYRTTERKGTLATTGHSTNFVMDIQLPSDRPQDYWIRGGVALLLELSE